MSLNESSFDGDMTGQVRPFLVYFKTGHFRSYGLALRSKFLFIRHSGFGITYLPQLDRFGIFFKKGHISKKCNLISGDLKFEHSKSEENYNPECLKIIFQMVQFSKDWGIAIVPTI